MTGSGARPGDGSKKISKINKTALNTSKKVKFGKSEVKGGTSGTGKKLGKGKSKDILNFEGIVFKNKSCKELSE